MAHQRPYIGSKISLISKLDIRYEGIIYTVDTNVSIALVKVRSFGTEDRPTPNPVAARDDVYDYIIFKASDINDLIVYETLKMGTEFDGIYVIMAIKNNRFELWRPECGSSTDGLTVSDSDRKTYAMGDWIDVKPDGSIKPCSAIVPTMVMKNHKVPFVKIETTICLPPDGFFAADWKYAHLKKHRNCIALSTDFMIVFVGKQAQTEMKPNCAYKCHILNMGMYPNAVPAAAIDRMRTLGTIWAIPGQQLELVTDKPTIESAGDCLNQQFPSGIDFHLMYHEQEVVDDSQDSMSSFSADNHQNEVAVDKGETSLQSTLTNCEAVTTADAIMAFRHLLQNDELRSVLLAEDPDKLSVIENYLNSVE